MSTTGLNLTIQRVPGLRVRTQDYIPPQKSVGPSKDVDEFLVLVNDALQIHQENLNLDRTHRLSVRAAWPKDPVEQIGQGLSVVAMRVINRRPANMSPDRERRQLKPRFREVTKHPTDPKLRIVISTLPLDNIVEFRVMSSDCSTADDWALFFERFMQSWTFYFKDAGIQEVRFEERMADTIEVIGGSDIYIRPIRFFVRTELVSQAVAHRIDEVRVEMDGGLALNTEIIDPELGISDHFVARRLRR